MRVIEPKINAHNFVKGDQSTVLQISYYGVKNRGNARIPPQVNLSGVDNVLMNVSTRAENAPLTPHLDKLDVVRLSR